MYFLLDLGLELVIIGLGGNVRGVLTFKGWQTYIDDRATSCMYEYVCTV